MKNQSIELLAPVGSFECLHAAISAGADSIYFGVEQLNMRTRSSKPFSIEDIKDISLLCKLHHIKAYITLNTVMYEHDMQLLKLILQEVKEQQIDAVIAADFSVIEFCNQLNIPLHISTQANVSNIESVQFFARFADVVVLARELTLKQVAHIKNEIVRRNITGVSGQLIKIELFVHGALCMAISGKCYLSLHAQNASANRGACIQNCRRSYTVTDTETKEELVIENEYIMSPKDLCTIGLVDQLIDSGVDVFKIEGRSKGADYVFMVTNCYREAIAAVKEGSYTPQKIEEWTTRLSTVYNRGFWEGYYLGRNLGEWTKEPGSIAAEKKIYVGRGSNYYAKINVGEFTVESSSIKIGDELMIIGPAIGLARQNISSLIVNGVASDIAIKGDKITFPFNKKISTNDKLYKIIK